MKGGRCIKTPKDLIRENKRATVLISFLRGLLYVTRECAYFGKLPVSVRDSKRT